ncbi:MAG: substrate-binding domain-containing protein [Dysosmobacter sp.]
MKHKVIWQLVVPLLGLCVLFMLLATEPAKVQARQEPVEISVILRETENGTGSATRQGMEQAAMDLNVELRVLTLSRENDAEEQRDLLEREVASGADGVLLIPADREVLSEAVETAANTVLTMETDMSQDGASGYISVDNDALGRMLGDIALNGAPEGSSVLLLSGVSEATGISDRLTAAQEVLEAAGRKVYRCVLRPEESLESVLEGELAALAPAAVVAFDTSTLERTALVLREKESAPLLYGAGSSAAIAAYLEQGAVTAVVARNEFAAGYLAVEALVEVISNHADVTAPPLSFSVVRKENMYDPENQKLLFPVTR